MPLPRKRPNSYPIEEESSQEHLRNAQMLLESVIDELEAGLKDALKPDGTVVFDGEGFSTLLQALHAVDRRMGKALFKMERKNPPVSESRSLDEISRLLKQVRVKDDSDHQLVKEIAFIVGQLRMQVRLGQHTNTPSRAARSKAITLLRQRAGGRLRQNPAMLGVLGLNPPPMIDGSVEPIQAMWGEIHYVRPDDPEGKDVVRVHEFKHGFRALPLTDGRVLLESRKDDRLWTVE